MPLIVLSESDAEILRSFLAEARKSRQGTNFKRDTERTWEEGEDHQAPEVYIANPQAEIAARSGLVPGKGDADIYYIDTSDQLAALPGHDRELYNLATSMLKTSDYLPVWRDKYGSWISTKGGGAGTEIIRFKIISVSNNVATVEITARPCGTTAVTGESDGQVDVYDPCNCFLDEPDADLVGRCGGAWYTDPTGEVATGTGTVDTEAGGTGTDVTACRWEFLWLCCPACP